MRKKYSREKKNRSGEIPTGSFSDIAFLLIIYFLVATTLVKVKAITADLPTGEKTQQEQPDKTPIVPPRLPRARLSPLGNILHLSVTAPLVTVRASRTFLSLSLLLRRIPSSSFIPSPNTMGTN